MKCSKVNAVTGKIPSFDIVRMFSYEVGNISGTDGTDHVVSEQEVANKGVVFQICHKLRDVRRTKHPA